MMIMMMIMMMMILIVMVNDDDDHDHDDVEINRPWWHQTEQNRYNILKNQQKCQIWEKVISHDQVIIG